MSQVQKRKEKGIMPLHTFAAQDLLTDGLNLLGDGSCITKGEQGTNNNGKSREDHFELQKVDKISFDQVREIFVAVYKNPWNPKKGWGFIALLQRRCI
jgi:hypothetical protein